MLQPRHFLCWSAIAFLLELSSRAELLDKSDWQWRDLWTREAKAGELTNDLQVLHNGKPSVRIGHRGTKDWSREPIFQLEVQEGDILELASAVKLEGKGNVAVSVVTRDKNNKVVEWMYGARESKNAVDWQLLKTRLVVPQGATSISPRITGHGPATIWMEGFRLQNIGNTRTLRQDLPDVVKLENSLLSVTFHPREATFDVLDRRTGQTWTQQSVSPGLLVTRACFQIIKLNIPAAANVHFTVLSS